MRGDDDTRHIIEPLEEDGWEFLSFKERPEWVEDAAPRSIAENIGLKYKYDHYHGDTFVYKVTSTVHGNGILVFRKLKSDYHETTSEEGTCPNCQSYVERFEDDDYLTCHRCGWQYKPISDRLKNLF